MVTVLHRTAGPHQLLSALSVQVTRQFLSQDVLANLVDHDDSSPIPMASGRAILGLNSTRAVQEYRHHADLNTRSSDNRPQNFNPARQTTTLETSLRIDSRLGYPLCR